MEDDESEPIKKQIPFKLCFVSPIVKGKSRIEFEKLVSIVTPKFYSKYDNNSENSIKPELLKKYLDYLNIKEPKEKYKRPPTENLKYGWYHFYLTDINSRNDPRLNFAKHTNPLIREHLMNYAKIRGY